jgi:hypothetical protein
MLIPLTGSVAVDAGSIVEMTVNQAGDTIKVQMRDGTTYKVPVSDEPGSRALRRLMVAANRAMRGDGE